MPGGREGKIVSPFGKLPLNAGELTTLYAVAKSRGHEGAFSPRGSAPPVRRENGKIQSFSAFYLPLRNA